MTKDVRTATLQSAAASGNGTAMDVAGYSTVAVGIIGSTGADRVATFEGSQDGTNYVAIMAQNKGTLAQATTATVSSTTPQLWVASVAGLRKFRVPLSGGATGTATITATAVQGGFPGWPVPAA